MNRYSDRRSPDRDRYAPGGDSYVPSSGRKGPSRDRSPGSFRRRSPSPGRQGGSWRGTRSPPHRSDTYAREPRPRSPPREYAENSSRPDGDTRKSRSSRSRSPPPLKRGLSPRGRATRSPLPPPKRERISSPPRTSTRARSPPRRQYSPQRDSRGSYRARSRSPHREDRVDPYATKSWRRRSPSPRDGSGRNSLDTSRRSSPRPYDRRPPEAGPSEQRALHGPSSTSHRSPRPRSPTQNLREYESRSRALNGESVAVNEAPPTGPARDRAPPTGPSHHGPSPPHGPSTLVSMSAHNRPDGASGYTNYGGRGGYRGRGGPAGLPSRHSSGTWPVGAGPYGGRGLPRDPYPSRDPNAPRRGDHGPGASFRGNSTSTTYPRTQRFNMHLQDLPQAKPGGEKLPPLHDTAKADKLEEEAARLRKMIDDKEAKKRQGLREWERMEREASTNSLKSELAEEHLRTLNGESGEGTTAAF